MTEKKTNMYFASLNLWTSSSERDSHCGFLEKALSNIWDLDAEL